MAHVSLRLDDVLLDRVRAAALRGDRSVNRYIVDVLAAATDPDLAGTDVERIRERLQAAGLLEDPVAYPVGRPAQQEVRGARRRAGRGTSLSDLVTEERR